MRQQGSSDAASAHLVQQVMPTEPNMLSMAQQVIPTMLKILRKFQMLCMIDLIGQLHSAQCGF